MDIYIQLNVITVNYQGLEDSNKKRCFKINKLNKCLSIKLSAICGLIFNYKCLNLRMVAPGDPIVLSLLHVLVSFPKCLFDLY